MFVLSTVALRAVRTAVQPACYCFGHTSRQHTHTHTLSLSGVMTTTEHTGQQWDAPNAWPPLQHIVIESLSHTDCPKAHDLARQLAGTHARKMVYKLAPLL